MTAEAMLKGYGLIDPAEVAKRFKGDYASAAEILAESLVRVIREREGQAGYIVDLRDQLETAELMHSEAVIAERELRRLLDGDLYQPTPETTLQAVDAAEIEAQAAADATKPEPEAEPDAPLVVVDEPTPIAEPAVVAEERAASPVAIQIQRTSDAKHDDDKTVAEALDRLWDAHPEGLSTVAVSVGTGLEYPRAYAAINRLAKAGRIDYVRRRDKNEKIVVRKGAELPTPTLTANQARVLGYLAAKPDNGLPIAVSYLDIAVACELAQGSVQQVTDALAVKGFIEVVGRGKAGAPRSYRVLKRDGATPALKRAPVQRVELEAPQPVPGLCRVPDLRRGLCHWPLEHSPCGADQAYCAKPCADDEEYCRVHRLSMYRPRADKKSRPSETAH